MTSPVGWYLGKMNCHAEPFLFSKCEGSHQILKRRKVMRIWKSVIYFSIPILLQLGGIAKAASAIGYTSPSTQYLHKEYKEGELLIKFKKVSPRKAKMSSIESTAQKN